MTHSFSVKKNPLINQRLRELPLKIIWDGDEPFLYDAPFSVTGKPQINQPLRKFMLPKKRVLLYDAVVFCEEKPLDKPTTYRAKFT